MNDYALALANFGMSFYDFLRITPKEFYLALKHKNDYDGLVVETSLRLVCNTIRTSTKHLLNVSGKSLKRNIRRDIEVMKFPWDNKPVRPQTREEMKRVMKSIVAYHKPVKDGS